MFVLQIDRPGRRDRTLREKGDTPHLLHARLEGSQTFVLVMAEHPMRNGWEVHVAANVLSGVSASIMVKGSK